MQWGIGEFDIFTLFLTLGVKKMTEITHARPPILPAEIYQAVAVSAEKYAHAKVVVIRYSEALTNVSGVFDRRKICDS